MKFRTKSWTRFWLGVNRGRQPCGDETLDGICFFLSIWYTPFPKLRGSVSSIPLLFQKFQTAQNRQVKQHGYFDTRSPFCQGVGVANSRRKTVFWTPGTSAIHPAPGISCSHRPIPCPFISSWEFRNMKHFGSSGNLSQDPILLFTRTIYKKSLKKFPKKFKKV